MYGLTVDKLRSVLQEHDPELLAACTDDDLVCYVNLYNSDKDIYACQFSSDEVKNKMRKISMCFITS